MQSTLTKRKSDFESAVGHQLGYGRGTVAGEPAWDSYQLLDIKDCINSGYSNFLYPVSPDGSIDSYDWTFLRPVGELTLAQNGREVALPDDFGTMDEQVVVAATSTGNWPVPVVGVGKVLSAYALMATTTTTNTGPPQFVAVQPLKGTTPNHGARYKLIVFPQADKAYTLKFPYTLIPDALSEEYPYAYCSPPHHETLLEAMLAVAEVRYDDLLDGPHSQLFMRRLAASIAIDRRNREQLIGYCGDRSDERGQPLDRKSSLEGGLVTFNGTLWD